MNLFIITLNVIGWPIIHLAIAGLFLKMPDAWFTDDSWLTRARRFERGGLLYHKALRVQRWKGLLPDGAPWLGGTSKKQIKNRCFADLEHFAVETRRAEFAHWCMLLCTPLFYVWNPMWACVVMTFYGTAANLPCIIVQRVNRMKIALILAHPNAQCEMRAVR